MRHYDCGQDPLKSLDLEELTELAAAAAQSLGRTVGDHYSSEAGHAKTKRARLPSGLVSGHSSLQISAIVIPMRYLGTFPSSPSLVRSCSPWTLTRLFAPSTRVHDNSNVGTLEIPTKSSTVTVTVMVTLSHVMHDPFVPSVLHPSDNGGSVHCLRQPPPS